MKKQIYDLRLENIVSGLAGLRKSDLEKLAEQVCSMLSKTAEQDRSVYSLKTIDKKPPCSECGSVAVIKYGKDSAGHQRYCCKDCNCTFTAISSTIFSGTQKDAGQWKDFILYTLEGRSLTYCAEMCHISVPTSFAWRHKLMNALSSQQFSKRFAGLVEIDEMFVNVSYKGNHKHSKKFTMPRPAYKRGSDNRSRFPKDKACVLCATERNKGFSGVVTHRGTLNSNILSQVFDQHISDDTLVITDESKPLNKYFQSKPYAHIAVPSAEKEKKAGSSTYHINNVNALHGRFRAFLRQYKGVSTKHLNNYLALFLWIENNIERTHISTDSTLQIALNTPAHITHKEIFERPMLLAG